MLNLDKKMNLTKIQLLNVLRKRLRVENFLVFYNKITLKLMV